MIAFQNAIFSANEIREIFTSISRKALILLSGEQGGIGQVEFKIVGHRGVMRVDMADILEDDIDVDVAEDMLSIIFSLSGESGLPCEDLYRNSSRLK